MMTVADLIAWLREQQQDLPVLAYNDGMCGAPSLSVLEANAALQIDGPALFVGGPGGMAATVAEMAERLEGCESALPVRVCDDGDFADAQPAVIEAGDFYRFERVDRRSVLI